MFVILLTIFILAILFGGMLVSVAGFVYFILWVIEQSKKDIHFMRISPETGKIVRKGGAISNIFFNSKSGHYGKDGLWVDQPQDLGRLFRRFGFLFYGIYPIWNVLKFDISLDEYTKGTKNLVTKEISGCDSFTRFYEHRVTVTGAEMAKEGTGESTSVTKIDADLLLKVELFNVVTAIFKISPEGVDFKQVNSAAIQAFGDYVVKKKWEAFKDESKGPQDSDFVKHMIAETNKVLESVGIGMRINAVEITDPRLTASPENEELAKSQTLNQIAENEGEANITREKKGLEAAKLKAQQVREQALGERDALLSIKEVVGDGIGEFANLGQVSKTQLRVYGKSGSPVPIINTEGEEKGEEK